MAEGGRETRPWSHQFGPYLTMGIQLALAVVAFFFLGRWMDTKLGTTPWLMLAGLMLGIVGGFIKFFRAATSLGREANREAEEHRKAGGEG